MRRKEQRDRSSVASRCLAIFALTGMGELGCSNTGREFLPLPDLAPFESIIVLHDGAEPEARASETDEVRVFDADPGDTVIVLAYALDLDALKTPAGVLDPNQPDRSCLLFDPSAAWAMLFDEASQPRFVPLEGSAESFLSEEQLTLLRGAGPPVRCQLCPSYRETRVALGEKLRVFTSIQLPSDDIVIGRVDDRVQVLTPDDDVVDVDCGRGLYAMTVLPDGGLWGGDEDWSGRVELDLETETCTITENWPLPLEDLDQVRRARDSGVRWLAAAPAGAPSERWALTGRGRLWKRFGDEWRRMASMELHPNDREFGSAATGALLWLGPNRVASHVAYDRVLLLDEGVPDVEFPPLLESLGPESDRVRALDQLEDGRLIGGGTQGEVFLRSENGRWELQPDFPIENAKSDVSGFGQTPDHWVVTIERGRVGFVHRERGVCPTALELTGAVQKGNDVFARADRSIVIADYVGDDNDFDAEVIILHPSQTSGPTP